MTQSPRRGRDLVIEHAVVEFDVGIIGRPRRGCDGWIDDDGPVQWHLGVVAQ
jgi:hypothetical protein